MRALLLALLVLPASAQDAPRKAEARRIAFSLDIAAREYAKAVGTGALDKAEQEEAVGFLEDASRRFARLASESGLDDFTRGPVDEELAALLKEARAGRGDPQAFRARAARAGLDLARAFGTSSVPVPVRAPDAVAGAEVFRMHCAMCHGARGDGRGPAYPGLNPKPASFTDSGRMARTAPADLFRVVTVGVEGTAMTSFEDRLSEEQRWDAVAYLYGFTGPSTAALAGLAPAGGGWGGVREELARVSSLARAGDASGAADAAADAYLRFEPLEREARARAPSETARAEALFSALRDAAASGADLSARSAELSALLDALEAAKAPSGPWALFLQSFLIIGREGFEAILVLAAIAAVLARGKDAAAMGSFKAGAWAGVAASFATAWALEALFTVTPIQREALEGLVMLAAAATLVYVSYWMLATASARRWNRWLRGRLGAASAEGGSRWALASVSFLAVYREGFETVLFYKALWGMAPGAGSALAAGFLAGCAALAALFLALRRGGLRLPMRPFFLGTGALLYALAFTFVGQAAAELQAAGWLQATATPWAFSWPAAGVHPTWQSSAPQLALLVAGAAAVALGARRPQEAR